jgi:tetratricopeptide (TPR) repeat protein/CHAT domain-containing protein
MPDTITILDFHIKPHSHNRYSIQVYPRDKAQPLAAGEFEYALDYMTEFQLNELNFDGREPAKRFERLKSRGKKLYEKLFAPEIQRVWNERKDPSQFLVLCLRIDPEAEGLEALPWETIYDPEEEEFIAAGAKTGMSRLPLDIEPQDGLPGLAAPLKMLALVSSPLDLQDNERLQIEREQEILLQAINTPAGRGRLRLEMEDEAKLDILENDLEAGYQIFHYTGHGYFSGEAGGGLLVEGSDGKGRPTGTAEVLQALQKGGASLRLAVLSGCQTARTAHLAGFRDMARGLARHKVPAVIAMQFSISDVGGLKFAEVLYSRLAEGRVLEKALNSARRALLQSDDPFLQGDALAPVLITSNGGCLRSVEPGLGTGLEAGLEIKPVFDPGFYLGTLPQLGLGFFGRRREYRQVRDGLIYRGERAVIAWGIGGIGKTALMAYAATRMRRHFRGVYAFDCSGAALAPERIMLDLHRFLERQGLKALEPLIHQSLTPEEAANFLAQILTQFALLLIFDNFETHVERTGGGFQIADESLRAFLTTLVRATASGSKFIFTCRYLFDLDKKRIGAIQELPLGDLSRPEAISLMQKLPNLSAADYDEKVAAFETFGGHPYALVALDRYCGHAPLSDALKNIKPVTDELRGFLAIDLNYSRLSDRARELLDRMAAFREPVAMAAAEWVMGEKVPVAEAFLKNADPDAFPDGWKALDEAELLRRLDSLLPEKRQAADIDRPISELIEWGLLTPVSDDGQARSLAVHSLVRDFCRERQGSEVWGGWLRDAAAFYTNQTKLTRDDQKSQSDVWVEMEAFELLMEAEDYEDAASLLAGATELLDRWGFGRFLESQYGHVMSKVGKEARAVLLHNYGVFLQDRGEYEEALEKYEQSLRIKEGLGNRAGVASSLHQIGNLHYLRGDYDEALEKYEESLGILMELGNRAGVAISLHQIGNLHYLRGEYDEALEKYEESLGILMELGNRAGVANSLHQIGMIHQERGEYDEALEKYEESLRIAEELGDRAGVAISVHQIGRIHEKRGEYDEALAKYEESLRIEEELGNRAGVAISLHQIGMIHEERGEYDEALAKYQGSLRIKEELGNRAGVASSLHQIGRIHEKRGEYDEALAKYEESLRIKEEIGNRAGAALSSGQIGALFTRTGRYTEAFDRLMQALLIFMELGSPSARTAVAALKALRSAWGRESFDPRWKEAIGTDFQD